MGSADRRHLLRSDRSPWQALHASRLCATYLLDRIRATLKEDRAHELRDVGGIR